MLANWVRRTREPGASNLAGSAGQALEQARGFVAAGDLSRAEAAVRDVMRTCGDCADAHWLLGSILGAAGRLNDAQGALEHALSMEPRNAPGLTDLGNVYALLGRNVDAERCFRRALESEPSNRAARFSFARIEEQLGHESSAIEVLTRLLEPPAFAPALPALVRLLDRLGRVDEAKRICAEVLSREPGQGAAHAALGFLLLKRELNAEAALVHLDLALQAGFREDDVLSNRGIALQDLGRLDEALASYDAALKLRPDYHAARFHRALALLLRGEFDRAWPDYEVRLSSEDAPRPPCQLPRWSGENLAQATLVVYGEQGIGDELMFASCLPDLLERCPNVVLTCSAKLESIFRRSFPQIEVMSNDRLREPVAIAQLNKARASVAIGSVPLHFRMSLTQFPRHHGYLRADPALAAHYHDRLQALGPGPKVGVSWRGGTARSRQALRSLHKDLVERILAVPGIQFVNLQYDSTGSEPEIADAIDSGRVCHWPEALADYDQTAALVHGLDVVVSVCTSVIHLAGALGRPVWVMAPFSPEWRYGIAGEAMPWYPSAKVIRQRMRGDWSPVIAEVRARLQALSV